MSATPSEILEFTSVRFDETDEVRDVARDCKKCGLCPETYGEGVVSPSGIAHIVPAYGETTLCGKDATGDKWWWPL